MGTTYARIVAVGALSIRSQTFSRLIGMSFNEAFQSVLKIAGRVYVLSSDSSSVILPLNSRSGQFISSATKAMLGERDASIPGSNRTQILAGRLFLTHSAYYNSPSPAIACVAIQVIRLVITQTIAPRFLTLLCPTRMGSKSCLGWGAFLPFSYAMSRKEVNRWDALLCSCCRIFRCHWCTIEVVQNTF